MTFGSTWNTRLRPPPLTVTPAAGPVIVCVPPVLLSSSCVPVRVITCGVANTASSKLMFELPAGTGVGEGDGLAQAQQPRARGEDIAGVVHDERREDLARVRQLERDRAAQGGGHGVAAKDVVGRGDERRPGRPR